MFIIKKRIATTNAPAALGPYAQAVDTGDTVYCSGQLGLGTLEFHSLGLGPLSGDADAFGLGQRLTFGLLLDR